jgi:hypothetical protein
MRISHLTTFTPPLLHHKAPNPASKFIPNSDTIHFGHQPDNNKELTNKLKEGLEISGELATKLVQKIDEYPNYELSYVGKNTNPNASEFNVDSSLILLRNKKERETKEDDKTYFERELKAFIITEGKIIDLGGKRHWTGLRSQQLPPAIESDPTEKGVIYLNLRPTMLTTSPPDPFDPLRKKASFLPYMSVIIDTRFCEEDEYLYFPCPSEGYQPFDKLS